MPFMKQKLRYRELFRFIITGTIITVIHYSIYLALSNFLSLNIAYTTGFIISFVCNFLLSNYYTFKTKPSVKNAIRFCGSHVINYLLQISCFNLFIFLGVPKAYACLDCYSSDQFFTGTYGSEAIFQMAKKDSPS